jgi:hypothetical protein
MKTENMSFVTVNLSLLLYSKQTLQENPLQYTNKETRKVHILRYATNQPSFFIEKQSTEPGSVLISEIIFNYGRLKFRQISICKSFYSYILTKMYCLKNTIRKRNLLKR